MSPVDGAVAEPFGAGTTSGLTAVDQARAGRAHAVRTLIAAPPGTALEVVLGAIGYSTAGCPATVAGAVAAIERVQPHVVFLDAAVAASGAIVANVITTQGHPPIIVIERAATAAATGDRWLAAGADDHLTGDQLTAAIVRRAVESAIARGRARDLRLRLGQADRLAAIATLAAGVAHEVNNPASYVLMNLRTCRDHLDELRRELVDAGAGDGTPSPLSPIFDEMSEMFVDNIRGVERIVSIIGSLRAFARPEPDVIEPVDLAAICRDVHSMIGSQLRHQARVTLDLEPVPTVAADPRKLGQVVLNLLVNAADTIAHGDADGHEIRVRLTTRGPRVELSVSDTGAAIPATHRARIFDPFFTTRPGSGASGLGLATVRTIVERFGGRVTVDSAGGRGSTFTVSLPRVEPRLAAAPADRVAPAASRARVMIIDDELALTSALRRQLRGHHDVTVMNEGAAALAAVLRDDYDVILCDVMMPGLDGIAVLESLRTTRPDLAARLVLMTAGVWNEPMHERVLALGGRLLTKPVPLETLLGVIATLRGQAARALTP